MTTVVFWGRIIGEPVISRLRAVPTVTVDVVETADALIAAMPRADAIVMPGDMSSYTAPIAAALATHATRLRWLQLVTAGYDAVSAHGIRPGVTVTLPGGNSRHVVAEHAMALFLALARAIPAAALKQSRATWDRGHAPTMSTLECRTLAVVGFGHIGKEIARRARAFEMRIVAVTRTPHPDPLADEVLPRTALHEVLARSDAVALALPLTTDSRYILDAAAFAHCKPNALVVNISRGGLIDPAALLDALQRGLIAGAGIDVTDPEPLPDGHPLWSAPNLLITPHVAGYGSPRSRVLMADAIGANLERFVAGQPLLHAVTP